MKKLLNTSLLLIVLLITFSTTSFAADDRTIQVKGPSDEIYTISQILDKDRVLVIATYKDEVIYSADCDYAISRVVNLCISGGTNDNVCPSVCDKELNMDITLDDLSQVHHVGQIYETLSNYPNYSIILVRGWCPPSCE